MHLKSECCDGTCSTHLQFIGHIKSFSRVEGKARAVLSDVLFLTCLKSHVSCWLRRRYTIA